MTANMYMTKYCISLYDLIKVSISVVFCSHLFNLHQNVNSSSELDKSIEHYLEVCAGKPDCTEMKMVHLHFCAVRFT